MGSTDSTTLDQAEWGESSGGLRGCVVGLEGGKEHMMPIGFVISHHLLKHGLDDFIDRFDLAITLGVVGR